MTAKRHQLRPLPKQVAQQSTLLASWVIVIYRLLEYKGLYAKGIFEDSGIDLKSLRNPEARIPHHLVSDHVWRIAAKEIGDEVFVLDSAKVKFPGMYHSLSIAMSNAPNILTGLGYLAAFRRIFHPLSRINLSEVSEGYSLYWGPKAPYVTTCASDALISSVIGQCRELTSESFAPKYVLLKHKLSDRARIAYENFFKAPVSDEQLENSMIFDRRTLREPLLTANPRIERMCVQLTKEYIGTLDQKEIVNTAYCKIVEALPTQLHTEDAIADDLNISLRTLQRRLHGAGTSFDRLLKEVRKELALSYMHDVGLSIQEVSYLVGFKEPGNSSRAFKKWTGETPSSYRSEI